MLIEENADADDIGQINYKWIYFNDNEEKFRDPYSVAYLKHDGITVCRLESVNNLRRTKKRINNSLLKKIDLKRECSVEINNKSISQRKDLQFSTRKINVDLHINFSGAQEKEDLLHNRSKSRIKQIRN